MSLGNTAGTCFNAIPDRENGLWVTEESFQIGDYVEIHMRTTRNGSVSKCGEVTEIDVNRPNRVKMDTCPRYFRRILKLIRRRFDIYEFK